MINESDGDVAVSYRVEFVDFVLLAFLIELGEEFAEHEDDLLRLDGRGITCKAGDVGEEDGDVVEVIDEIELLGRAFEQELISNVVR